MGRYAKFDAEFHFNAVKSSDAVIVDSRLALEVYGFLVCFGDVGEMGCTPLSAAHFDAAPIVGSINLRLDRCARGVSRLRFFNPAVGRASHIVARALSNLPDCAG